MAEIQ